MTPAVHALARAGENAPTCLDFHPSGPGEATRSRPERVSTRRQRCGARRTRGRAYVRCRWRANARFIIVSAANTKPSTTNAGPVAEASKRGMGRKRNRAHRGPRSRAADESPLSSSRSPREFERRTTHDRTQPMEWGDCGPEMWLVQQPRVNEKG